MIERTIEVSDLEVMLFRRGDDRALWDHIYKKIGGAGKVRNLTLGPCRYDERNKRSLVRVRYDKPRRKGPVYRAYP